MKDADVVALYRVMREALVYLTHLDTADTTARMLEKLRVFHHAKRAAQEGRPPPPPSSTLPPGSPAAAADAAAARAPGWAPLNRLCWAVGSVSGTLPTDDESRFLVMVVKDLLDLCEKAGQFFAR